MKPQIFVSTAEGVTVTSEDAIVHSVPVGHGHIFDGSSVRTYGGQPVRWSRVEAPTVGRAWKAPVYLCSDGTEFIDFNNQIEIEWNESV